MRFRAEVWSRYLGALAVLASVLLAPSSAQAAPIAVLEYVETALGGGLYQYDYTLRNAGDPVDDDGFDLYDLTIVFPSLVTLESFALPASWASIPDTTPVSTVFFNAFSISPGLPPAGADIAPGQALSGFRLVLDAAIGNTAFLAVFANPADVENPVVFEGVSTPAWPRAWRVNSDNVTRCISRHVSV